MIDWVDELLAEWGRWQAQAPGVPRTGYPSCSPGSQLINTERRLSARDKRLALLARQGSRRRVELAGGRLAPVLPMVPQGIPKQTRSSRAWSMAEWPEQVERTEAVVLQMTDRQRQAVKLKYWHSLTNAEAAKLMRCSVARFKTEIDGAHNFFVGYWIAARLTG